MMFSGVLNILNIVALVMVHSKTLLLKTEDDGMDYRQSPKNVGSLGTRFLRKIYRNEEDNCLLGGIDFYGNDLTFLQNVPSAYDCACKCKEKSGCLVFTWNMMNKRCYLKSSHSGLVFHPHGHSGTTRCCPESIFKFFSQKTQIPCDPNSGSQGFQDYRVEFIQKSFSRRQQSEPCGPKSEVSDSKSEQFLPINSVKERQKIEQAVARQKQVRPKGPKSYPSKPARSESESLKLSKKAKSSGLLSMAASPPPPAPRPAPQPAQHAPAPVAAPPSAPMAAQPAQPSLMKQMAATAGGVAIGSAVGHVAGSAITGMMGGGGSSQPHQDQYQQQPQAYPQQEYAPQQQYAPPQQESQGACAWEIKSFIQCAQTQSDLSLCDGFNEALKQCKLAHGI